MEDAKFDFVAHLKRQAAWSKETFGPGPRTEGVSDHIRKELLEIAADPTDLAEWIDVVILALDGAWRCGGSPEQIIAGIVAKQTKNEGRNWPDWRTADPTKAIEHDRSGESAAAPQVVADERAALALALEALTESRPKQDHYQEPMLRHAEAIKACVAALAAAPVQAQERFITDETAAKHLDDLMWEFIETSGNFPSVKIDPRTWEHALCYAPVQAKIPHQIKGALTLAMAICDAVPTRAHLCADNGPLKELGRLVNVTENGIHGYALIRDALTSIKDADPVQPVAVPDGWKLVPTISPTMAQLHIEGFPRIAFNHYAAIIANAPAAPAAQGDAKEQTDADYKEGEPGWRPSFCDGGGAFSNCCDYGGCAANRERAAIAAKAAS